MKSPVVTSFTPLQKWASETLGTAFLLATVVGSGIMAETLSGGNAALALMSNTLATGAVLYVLITIFAPIGGAHFNPAVTFGFWLDKAISTREAVAYIFGQIIGGAIGVVAAHAMFETPLFQIASKARMGAGQALSEGIATFGLVLAILLAVKFRPKTVPMTVALYIIAAYWFTASTSFANPAVTLARSLTDSFTGIRPIDAPLFIVMQMIGAGLAFAAYRFFTSSKDQDHVTTPN